MNLRNALKSIITDDEERAVSPVIGVILMVAITVILAAVIGTFVLGLGDRVSQASPNANFDFEYTAGNNDAVKITHDGGDGVEAEQLKVTVGGVTAWEAGSFQNDATHFDPVNDNWGTSKITAGASLEFNDADDDAAIDNGQTVKVIWSASGSDKTAVIGESEVNF